MSKNKCDHLVAVLKRHDEWENITEKEYLQFFYKFGAITGKYEALSPINKDIKENNSFYIVRDLGLEGVYECNGKEYIGINIKPFVFCPFCGIRFDWDKIHERHKYLFQLAKSRVDAEAVKARFRKKKQEQKEFDRQYRLEKRQEREQEELRRKMNIPKPRIGYIYVCKLDKNYKIGKSRSPAERMKEFTLLPYELENIFILKVKDYDKREKELHEHFADKRVRGEWFELNEEDIEYIKEYLKEYEVK